MKKLISLLALSLSLSLFANTVADADALFAARGENAENALQAAVAYLAVSRSAGEEVEKAKMLNEASKAYYFYAASSSNKDHQKKFHTLGMEKGEEAVKLLGGDVGSSSVNDSEQKLENAKKEQLAMGYYRFGSNLGKWATANGITSSLSKWPTLRKNMEKVIDLGFKNLEAYGANRVLGKAYYKLPAPMGSNKKSLEYLKEAYENTMHDSVISNYGMNNNFYAEILAATDDEAQAKKILNAFIAADANTLNIDRIPETKTEQKEAKEILEDL